MDKYVILPYFGLPDDKECRHCPTVLCRRKPGSNHTEGPVHADSRKMIRRTTLKSGEKKRNYSSKYALTSVVCCSKCQATYRRGAGRIEGKLPMCGVL